MSRSCFHVLIILFILYLPSTLSGQEYTTHVRHYSVEDGLSDRFVRDIYKDKNGFIWLATHFGVNRFDGYNFKHFNTNTKHLQNDLVTNIYEDAANNLWFSCSIPSHIIDKKGIHYYQKRLTNIDIFNINTNESINFNDKFEHAPFQLKDIFLFSNLKGQCFYFLTKEKRLYKYTDTFEEQTFPDVLKNKSLLDISPDGTIYTLEDGFVKEYDLSGQILQQFYYLPARNFTSVELDALKDGGFFIRSYKSYPMGMYNILYKKNRQDVQQNIQSINPSQQIAGSHFIFPIKQDDNQWLANHHGQLWQLTKNIESPSQPIFQNLTDKVQIFDQNIIIYKLYYDDNKNVWICTQEGVFIISTKKNTIKPYLKNIRASTRGIAVDKNQKIYVNAYNGSQIIDPTHDTVKNLDFNPNGGLSLLLDHQENLWSGTYGNLIYKYNTESSDLVKYEVPLANNNFLYQSNDLTIWLASHNGLLYLNTKRDSFVYYAHLNEFKDFNKHKFNHIASTQDGKGLWLSTTKGLYLLDFKKGIININTTHPSIHQSNIYHTYEDKDGIVWLATKGIGLIKWDRKKDSVEHFTVNEGLSHNIIYSIHEDKHNRLWIPSNYGLMCFDKATYQIQTLHETDGISHEEFNCLSNYQAPDGTLYLGGINGIMVFNPNDYEVNFTADFPLELIAIDKTNQRNGQIESLLTAHKTNETITLKKNERNLYLEFALLDFENIHLHQFAYQLEGIDKEWQNINENIIRINQLPYGEYTLKIKGKNASGKWSVKEISIPLCVKKPFYLRWWFFLLCFILLCDVIYFYWKNRTRRLRKEKEKLEKEVALRTEELHKDKELISQQAKKLQEINDVKSRFFRNISHELRTPLTLILGQAKLLKHTNFGKQVDIPSDVIERNSKKILRMTEDLLDLTRLDIHKLKYEPKPLNLYNFIKQLNTNFESYAKFKKIHLNLDYQLDESTWIEIDSKKLETILYNLLSNAVKFTPPEKRIELSVRTDGNDLQIKVYNEGEGISTEDLPFVFDRFFQAQDTKANKSGGIGIGLALCKELSKIINANLEVHSIPDEFTTFTLTIPLVICQAVAPSDVQQVSPVALEKNTKQFPTVIKDTILIVEDNMDMINYLGTILNGHYQIHKASNGLEAKKILEGNATDIDIIISDLMMPEMDGLELIEYLNGSEKWENTPIVLLTALHDKDIKFNAMKLGVRDYITKPFETEELISSIENLLLLQRNRQEEIVLQTTTTQDKEIPQELPLYEQKWMDNVIHIIDENYSNTIFCVPELAQKLNISTRQLARKLKKLSGFTPNNLIREIRLQKARILLESQSMSTVAEICFAVGYATPDYFSRLYKNRFGKFPSDYFTPVNRSK